jgi:hypothetical protein
MNGVSSRKHVLRRRILGAAFKQKVIELFRLSKMASSNREEMNRN